jgi:hypothetical protein
MAASNELKHRKIKINAWLGDEKEKLGILDGDIKIEVIVKIWR